MDTVDVSDMNEGVRFHVKLEIALRANAIRIQKLDSDPERFSEYVMEREQKIRKLLDSEGDLRITQDGKQIFP